MPDAYLVADTDPDEIARRLHRYRQQLADLVGKTVPDWEGLNAFGEVVIEAVDPVAVDPVAVAEEIEALQALAGEIVGEEARILYVETVDELIAPFLDSSVLKRLAAKDRASTDFDELGH